MGGSAKRLRRGSSGVGDAVYLVGGQRPLSLFVQMTSSFFYPVYLIPCCPQLCSSFLTRGESTVGLNFSLKSERFGERGKVWRPLPAIKCPGIPKMSSCQRLSSPQPRGPFVSFVSFGPVFWLVVRKRATLTSFVPHKRGTSGRPRSPAFLPFGYKWQMP